MKTLAEWLSHIERQHPREIELGLERVSRVYDRLACGRLAKQVITVAGTNGKGSTVAYIDAVGRAAGLRCGRYTSPHLLNFNERIVIDGVAVDDGKLCSVFAEIDAVLGEDSLTYFEHTSLAAFVLFSRSQLDLAILEVGLGGRLDAVNIIDPDVAVITTIGIDHQDWLGDNRELIGAEKAGIMRRNIAVISAERELPDSVIQKADELAVSLQQIDQDFGWQDAEPKMPGSVQRDNLATAIAALKSLPHPPLVTEEMIAAGAAMTLPGRFQQLHSSPDVYVDVAHNVQAAEQLAACIEQQSCAGNRLVILAMLKDKQPESVAACLDPIAGHWYLAGLEGPRGLSAGGLSDRLRGLLQAPASSHDSVTAAINQALADAGEDDQVIIFGSFLTVAEAIRYWN
jgi:dihydrofolate synthase/folylpolyglutamate synthase